MSSQSEIEDIEKSYDERYWIYDDYHKKSNEGYNILEIQADEVE